MGVELHRAGKTMPLSYGRRPRNINKYGHRFKAFEWAAFLQLYSLPLLRQRLQPRYYDHWRCLVEIWCLSTAERLSEEVVQRIHQLALAFVEGAQKLYYQEHRKRTPIMDSNVHGLLHLADAIRDMGPGWVTWAAPIERYCGTLASMARSKSHLNESLSNAVRLEDLLHHTVFARTQLGKDITDIIRPSAKTAPYRSTPIPGLVNCWFINCGVPTEIAVVEQYPLLEYMRNFYNMFGIFIDELPTKYLKYNKFRRDGINNGFPIGCRENYKESDFYRDKLYIQFTEMRGGFGTYDVDTSFIPGPGHASFNCNVYDRYGRQVMGHAHESMYGEVQFFAAMESPTKEYPSETTPPEPYSSDRTSVSAQAPQQPRSTIRSWGNRYFQGIHYLAYVRVWKTELIDCGSGGFLLKRLRTG
ncbi:hypothetical protein DFH27DRAFT_618472 [Peziza echinospora]|nr:hypothetical protein DFH27DRAFT_618472 [Peziza echinospora]